MEGKITRVLSEKGFFFIDEDYWCHNNNYNRKPEVGDIVEYERQIKDGKKNANRVKFIKSPPNPFSEYLIELENGYFFEKDYLKEDFILKYPQLLANLFFHKGNKVNQIRNYFDYVVNIAGVYKMRKDFNRVKIELNKLIPLVTKSLDKQNVSIEFKEFIIKNIQFATQDEDSFLKGFLSHFECIVNYFPTKQ